MNTAGYLRLFLFSIILFSCDCEVLVTGKVYSSLTGEPMKGVKLEMVEKNIDTYTDENGLFYLGEMTGFCYDPEIRVTYNKYKPFQIVLESNSNYKNYKLKSESEYIDFEKPFYPNPDNRNTFITSTSIEKYSQNFKIISDTLIIYLDEKDLNKEIEVIKKKLKKRYFTNQIKP